MFHEVGVWQEVVHASTLPPGKMPSSFKVLGKFYSPDSALSQMPPSLGLGDPVPFRAKIRCLLPLVAPGTCCSAVTLLDLVTLSLTFML